MNWSNFPLPFGSLWLLVLACASLSAKNVSPPDASLNIQSILPVTLHGTWQAPTCRRGEGGEGTFTIGIDSRRRVSGWFTNGANESAWPLRGQISRGGMVTARVEGGLRLRGVVAGTTNPVIEGSIVRRCTGGFEGVRPDTNCCVNPTNAGPLFPDANLAAYVSEQLQIPIDEITPGNLAALEEVYFFDDTVRDLTGLQYATNIYQANLEGSAITNYSALYHLPNLQNLYLSHLTNPVFVTNFTQLTTLSVRYSLFDDESLVRALPHVEFLGLEGTRFPVIAALASNPSLTGLYHMYADVTDVAPYGALTQLSSLYLYGNPIGDLTPLTALTNLSYVSLGGYPLTNLPAGFSSLKNLNFGVTETALSDLDWLNVPGPGVLYLQNNRLTNISRLAEALDLVALDLSGNPLADLAPLSQLPRLRTLSLHRVALTNLSFVPANLQLLLADDNAVSDLSPLMTRSNLSHLQLSRNQVSDLAPLAACTNLSFLSLNSNQIASVSGLGSSPKLRTLTLYQNQVSDVSPLTNLPALSSLDVSYNQITDVQPLASATGLDDLNLQSNGITDISPLIGLTNLTVLHLYGNPLDLTPGSPALHVIETLRSNGVRVTLSP